MSGRVIVVGSINTDLIVRPPRFPLPGETLAGRSFTVSGGGKGANQAIAAARLGASVLFVGAVGEDAYGDDRLAALVTDGVDVRGVRRVSGESSGVAVILVDDGGNNSIVIIAGANGAISADLVDERLSGLATAGDVICCQLEIPIEGTLRALEIGRQVGATTVLNAAPGSEDARQLLPLVDVLVVNEIEVMQVAGLSLPNTTGNQFDRAVRELQRYGATDVIVTLGEQGALAWRGGDSRAFAAETVEVVDTTGAGDAFVGALVALLADGWPLFDAIPVCVRAGTLAVTRSGAQPSLPFRRELFPGGQ